VAEDVAPPPAAVVEAPPARPAPVRGRAERARATAYYFRFTLAYMLLGMVAAAGIAILVVVLTRPGGVRAPQWSTFQPTGSPVARVRQIATRVSAEYRQATGRKLVSVLPGPLQATRFLQTDSGPVSVEVPITTLAVQPDVSTGKHEEGDYTTFGADSTVAYQMCGFGSPQQNCGIVSGTPSVSRGRVLRREALELALYTLKYVPGTDAVLTYLPPPAGQASPTSVLVARKDVQKDLGRPLTRTLTPRKVVLGKALDDRTTVDKLTLSHLYTYDYQTLPGDGTAILVLTAAISAK
jgi:hypothetical protein